MILKLCGLLFVVLLSLEAINGSAVNKTITASNQTQDVPVVSSTLKPETTTKDEPVKVDNSEVTVVIPKASEILTKLTSTPAPDVNPKPSEILTKPTTPAPDVKPTTSGPLLEPDLGKWIIHYNNTDRVCIIAQMAMQLNVTYPDDNNQFQNATLNVPKNSTVIGSCNNESIIISWGKGHSIQINFGRNETAKSYYISGMSLNVNATVLKNPSKNISTIIYQNLDKEFVTPLDMSYKCSKVQNVSLVSKDPKVKAVLSMSNTQFEAYMNKTKEDFAAAQDCDVFDTPDIVPIAVGCALAILVFVVLVAYLIGRKRTQNTGYLSM